MFVVKAPVYGILLWPPELTKTGCVEWLVALEPWRCAYLSIPLSEPRLVFCGPGCQGPLPENSPLFGLCWPELVSLAWSQEPRITPLHLICKPWTSLDSVLAIYCCVTNYAQMEWLETAVIIY